MHTAPPHERRFRGPPLAAGYTYIGLLILIALMGAALTVVSAVWHTVQKREKEQELLFIGHQFRRALELYSANGVGSPTRLEDLLKDPRVPGMRRYLRKIYRDPMTGREEWGLVRAGNGITGVHSLSEQQPLKTAEFALADQSFGGKKKYSEWVFAARAAGAPSAQPGTPGAQQTGASGTTPAGVPRPQPGASK